eukprot:gene16239-biopygen12796
MVLHVMAQCAIATPVNVFLFKRCCKYTMWDCNTLGFSSETLCCTLKTGVALARGGGDRTPPADLPDARGPRRPRRARGRTQAVGRTPPPGSFGGPVRAAGRADPADTAYLV